MTNQTIFKFFFDIDPISGVFLAFMAVLFVTGAFFARRKLGQFTEKLEPVKKEYQDNVNGIAQKLSPKEFIELNIDEQHTSGFVESIPGTLVSLGILGTFVGLGMAIGGASENMADQFTSIEDMKKVQGELSELLNAVSFKFRVSAWGIMLSILFNFAVQRRFEEKLEECIEGTARGLLPYYQSIGDTIVNTARVEREEFQRVIQDGLLNAIQKMSDMMDLQAQKHQIQTESVMRDLADRVADAMGQQTRIGEKNLQIHQTLSADIQKLGKKINQIKDVTGAVEKATKRFVALAENTEQKMSVIQQMHEKAHERFHKQYAQTLADFKTEMKNIQESIGDHHNQHQVQFEKQIKTAEQQMKNISQTVNAFQQDQNATLLSNLERIVADHRRAVDATFTSLQTFDVSVQKTQSIQLGVVSSQATNFSSVLSSIQDSISERLSEHQSFTEAQLKTALEKFEETQQHAQSSKDASLQLQQELNESVSYNQSLHEQLTMVFEQSNQQVAQLQQVFSNFERLFGETTIQIGLYDDELASLLDVETSTEPNKYSL